MTRIAKDRLRALLIDPSLFTPPYDQALTEGLEASGVAVTWITRPLRAGETSEIDGLTLEKLYYRGAAKWSVKQGGVLAKGRKALSHLASSRRLLMRASALRPDVVHFQWAVLPLVDAGVIRWLRSKLPVVLTVHDLSAFNGSASSVFQTIGFGQVLRAASALVVHTESSRTELIAQGISPSRILLIPHGPLTLHLRDTANSLPEQRDGRWRIVLFGKLQSYKGLDTLLDALQLLGPEVRAKMDIVVAGEPFMSLTTIADRVKHLHIDFRPRRLTEQQAHSLLTSADAFVFPYHRVEASGVLHLTHAYSRWIIASDIGAFREVVSPNVNGALVPPGDTKALAEMLYASIGRRPRAEAEWTSWGEIGRATRTLYESLLEARWRT